jgi:hyperosmotically inducible periplasmic protein
MKTTLNADRDAPLPRPIAHHLRTTNFEPPRRRWPGILAACVLGAGIAAAAVSSYYDSRSLGERVDAGVAGANAAANDVVASARDGAAEAAVGAATAADQVRESVQDTNITAAVKTALAADPGLSALRIEVTTIDGVVHLSGPAPDDKARERAQVLAAAPAGVISVDNRLVVSSGSTTSN